MLVHAKITAIYGYKYYRYSQLKWPNQLQALIVISYMAVESVVAVKIANKTTNNMGITVKVLRKKSKMHQFPKGYNITLLVASLTLHV